MRIFCNRAKSIYVYFSQSVFLEETAGFCLLNKCIVSKGILAALVYLAIAQCYILTIIKTNVSQL